jgi:hypothetical protein
VRSSSYELWQSGRCHFGDGAAHLASTVHPVARARARPAGPADPTRATAQKCQSAESDPMAMLMAHGASHEVG